MCASSLPARGGWTARGGRLNRPLAVTPPNCVVPPFLHISLAPLVDHPVERGPLVFYWVLVAKGDAFCHLDKPIASLS
jgi:hypothetical protein